MHACILIRLKLMIAGYLWDGIPKFDLVFMPIPLSIPFHQVLPPMEAAHWEDAFAFKQTNELTVLLSVLRTLNTFHWNNVYNVYIAFQYMLLHNSCMHVHTMHCSVAVYVVYQSMICTILCKLCDYVLVKIPTSRNVWRYGTHITKCKKCLWLLNDTTFTPACMCTTHIHPYIVTAILTVCDLICLLIIEGTKVFFR